MLGRLSVWFVCEGSLIGFQCLKLKIPCMSMSKPPLIIYMYIFTCHNFAYRWKKQGRVCCAHPRYAEEWSHFINQSNFSQVEAWTNEDRDIMHLKETVLTVKDFLKCEMSSQPLTLSSHSFSLNIFLFQGNSVLGHLLCLRDSFFVSTSSYSQSSWDWVGTLEII